MTTKNETAPASIHSDNAQFPEIQSLLRSYLNQDYEYISEDLDQVVLTYKRHTPADRLTAVRRELHQLLADHAHETDTRFSAVFDSLFHPEVDLDDWDGRNLRQALQHLIGLLEAPVS